MGSLLRTVATLAATTLTLTAGAAAHAGQRKIGVDPRQSGLDAAFVPDEPRSDLLRFRAHFGADLAGWTRQTPWPRVDEAPVGPRDDATALGFRRVGLHFGLGHGLSERFVIGVDFQYELTRGLTRTPWVPERSPKALGFSALPYLEIITVPDKLVRPFVMIRGGVGGSIVTTDGSSPVEHGPGETLSILHPSIGIGIGAHAFITPDVSLDGMVTIDHRWEYARGPQGLPDPIAAQMDLIGEAGHHAFGRRLDTSLALMVSRWF